MKFVFKKDQFRSARGKYSRLLNLYCRKCNCLVTTYQKDGPGTLLRLYFDRIFSPKSLISLQNQEIDQIPILKCEKCGEILGMPYIYEKENRKAFRLYQDAIIKKTSKITGK